MGGFDGLPLNERSTAVIVASTRELYEQIRVTQKDDEGQTPPIL